MMTQHRGWMMTLGLALLLLGGVLPMLTQQVDTVQATLATQQRANAKALAESRALENDRAADASLQQQLGDKAYQALFTPPARAALVADLRQIGLESGLHDFSLTLDRASELASTPDDLTTTRMTIKASAPDDRALYNFTARALAQLPGYLRLDKLSLRRNATAMASPDLLQAELTLRWLAFDEDALFARQQP